MQSRVRRVALAVTAAAMLAVIARRNGFTRRGPKATLAPDLVKRDFTAKVPNRLWVTDLTMTPAGEGRCGSPRCVSVSRPVVALGRPPPARTPTWS